MPTKEVTVLKKVTKAKTTKVAKVKEVKKSSPTSTLASVPNHKE